MARKPMSQAQRDAFRDRMIAARARKKATQSQGIRKVRGLSVPKQQMAGVSGEAYRQWASSPFSMVPERTNMARRGRRAKQKEANPMSDAEFVARQQEAAQLLGVSGGKKRRRGKKRSGGIIALVMGGNRKGGKPGRKRTMRGKGKNKAGETYSQVTSQLPIQVSIEVAEGLFSLASVGVDIYTTATKSAMDDVAFPVVQRVLSSVGRWGAQRYLSRKHAGLAATIAHGFSAMNGDRNGNFIRNNLRRFLDKSGAPSGD